MCLFIMLVQTLRLNTILLCLDCTVSVHVVFCVRFNLSLTQSMRPCYCFGFVLLLSIVLCCFAEKASNKPLKSVNGGSVFSWFSIPGFSFCICEQSFSEIFLCAPLTHTDVIQLFCFFHSSLENDVFQNCSNPPIQMLQHFS